MIRGMRGGGMAAAVLLAALLAGCAPQMSYEAPSPQASVPTPSADPSPSPSPTPSPTPTPIALKRLITSVKGQSCRHVWDLPKGAILTNVRRGGPTFVYKGKTYWRHVPSGPTEVLKAAPARIDTSYFDLEAHPNFIRYNGDKGVYTLVQRSPTDRHRLGVWICGA